MEEFIIKKCSIENCNKTNNETQICKYKNTNLYLCSKHRSQLDRYGKILSRTKFDKNEIIIYDNYGEIVLYNIEREEVARAKIDLEDILKCAIYKWRLDGNYVTTKANGKKIYLHRYVMDCDDSNLVVDHIGLLDGKTNINNTLENRKNFLRVVPERLNGSNMSLSKLNTSGYTGVSKRKNRNQWESYITIYGHRINLGTFPNIYDAVVQRLKAEKKYGILTQAHLFLQFGINDDTDLSDIPNIQVPEYYADKISVKFANDRAQKLNNIADLTLEQYIQIKEHFTDINGILRCAYCLEPLDKNSEILEHITPLNTGGGTTKSNIVVCCRRCNQSKYFEEFKVWYRKQPFYFQEREDFIVNYLNNTNKYVKDNVIYINILLDRRDCKYFKAYDINNNKVYISNNQTKFSIEHNLDQTPISRCLNPKHTKNSYNGFTFDLLSENEIIKYLISQGYEIKYLPKYYN